jgi:hypothetical protein
MAGDGTRGAGSFPGSGQFTGSGQLTGSGQFPSGDQLPGMPSNAGSGQLAGGVPAAGGPWGPPTGAPVSAQDPFALQSGAARQVGGLPAPGTPAWFGPGPAAPAPHQPPPSLWRATPPGAIIALAVAVLVWLAPFAFLAGFALSARARYARRRILTAFCIVGGFILVIPTIGALLNYGDLSTWYSSLRGWSLFGSLLMIVLILVMVNADLKNGPRRPGGTGGPPYGSGPYGDYPPSPGPGPWQQGPGGPSPYPGQQPPPQQQPPQQQPPRHSR